MKKGKYLILVVILAIYFLIFYFIYGRDSIAKSKKNGTLIIDNNAIWQVENGNWRNISYASEIEGLSWQEYKVYLSNSYFGTYFLWNSENKWYLFDSEQNPINYDGNMIASNLNYELNFKEFTTREITYYNEINKVLTENGLASDQKEYTVKDLVSIDYDGDGIIENFYLLSNVFPLETNPNVIFTIVFMEKNSVTYPMYSSVENNDGFNGCKPYISAIFDADGDKEYEILLSCGKYSENGTMETLYKFEKDSFKILINN